MTLWQNNPSLADILPVKKGSLVSKDNATLLHYWYEVSSDKIDYHPNQDQRWILPPNKFALVNKGGGFRKWSGNQEYVVKLDKKSYDLISKHGGHRTPELYFHESITWSAVTAGKPSFRYSKPGSIGGSGGFSIFVNQDSAKTWSLLGFLNSKVTEYFLNIFNPTINIQAGDVQRLPILQSASQPVIEIVENSVRMSNEDWNTLEKSEYFSSPGILYIAEHPLSHPQKIAHYCPYVPNLRQLLEKYEWRVEIYG